MHIEELEVFAFAMDQHYRVCGHDDAPERLPGTDYYFEPRYRHAYSTRLEACLVKLITDEGIVGWGEANAPLLPETTASIITGLVGPAMLGCDPEDVDDHYETLTHLMHARGHHTGFMHDAVAAIDLALWDIVGQKQGKCVADAIGGRLRDALPAYVSGLREKEPEKRYALARGFAERGFAGVKLFLGENPDDDARDVEAVREAIGDDKALYVDTLWKYDLKQAQRLAQVLDDVECGWFEAPLHPLDIHGHAILARSIATPVAEGETMRTVAEFDAWLLAQAIGVAQPDVMRCGITGAGRIAARAAAAGCPVAFHVGVGTGIGQAATWQLAAATENFLVQEHQLRIFEAMQDMFEDPLEEREGHLQVPDRPGLGIQVHENFVRKHSRAAWKITREGSRAIHFA